MDLIRKKCLWILYLAFLLKQNSRIVISQGDSYVPANSSRSWTSGSSNSYRLTFIEGSRVEVILSTGPRRGTIFGCGFICNGDCHDYLFAIFALYSTDVYGIYSVDLGRELQVVWSANRNSPVKINATLEVTTSGLVLKDSDEITTWSTTKSTGYKSVVGLKLTDKGNLVLLDKNGGKVWQSFDHPTDCLLDGQKLVSGQKLTASSSSSNWSEGGLYSLSVTEEGFYASIGSNPPYVYYQFNFTSYYDAYQFNFTSYYDAYQFNFTSDYDAFDYLMGRSENKSYFTLFNGTLYFYEEGMFYGKVFRNLLEGQAGCMRLASDGRLRMFSLDGLAPEVDVFEISDCAYPMVCGKYGVCTKSKCGCPDKANETNYFRQIDYKKPDSGCPEIIPLSCQLSQLHSFVELQDITYFTFTADLENIDSETCKQACLKNCSCKAAIFHYSLNPFKGECYLPTQMLSLMNIEDERNDSRSTTYIKVQNTPKPNMDEDHVKQKKNSVPLILGSSLGALFVLFLTGMLVVLFWKKQFADNEEEDYLDQVPGMPKRFSYEDLKSMTQNFNRKLGEGGFGTVFEGIQTDGTQIAVKRLDGFGQTKKSFVAEVATIGNIHHVNLVKVIGFCAEKSHRLLVYEYMSNGSLDKWIFHKTYELLLSWQQRKKIILDIAKGLSYLHEECRQKIIHLDIKPENILLDDEFNGKVSDFGLSKLVDRDQSQVMTTMRGTPGYLAPEWLSSLITEKVDVYSFGIVMMEILCGRRNIDRSQPEEAMHLLALFKKKYEENQVLGLIDKCCEDMRSNEEEVLNMMRVVAWCLQTDFAKRPSMSMVVKGLEGVTNVEYDLGLDYCFSGAKLCEEYQNHGAATLLLPSVLSQAR